MRVPAYKRRKRWIRRLGWIFAGSAVLLLLTIAVTGWRIWTYDVSTTRSADAAIVLGATVRDGQPSPVLVERIRHGIQLYRMGRVRKLIFSGGATPGECVSNAEAARTFAIHRGIPPDDIIIEPYSTTTRENLVYTRQIATPQELKTFLIVSDPLHMLRAMRMAEDTGLTAWPSATPTTRYRNLKDRLWFLKRETRFYLQYVLLTRFFPVVPMNDRAGGGAAPRNR